jgi:UV DNA damage endonuclease
MVDYSPQQSGNKLGKHVETIDMEHFKTFLENTRSYNYDLMLEIKDKEQNTLKVIAIFLYRKATSTHLGNMED